MQPVLAGVNSDGEEFMASFAVKVRGSFHWELIR